MHNPFQQFIANGYTADLLPILPPNAPLSPYSRLTAAHCGKTPALPTEDGYVGFANWPIVQATPKLIDGWLSGINGSGPCNVGLNARNVHAFDVDTHEREFSNAVFAVFTDLASDVLALTGIRIGRPPGFVVPFRPEHPHRKARLVFAREGGSGEKSAVELLGVGQQFVIAGGHAGTGQPYRWRPVKGTATFLDCPAAVLPVLSDARLDGIMEAIPVRLGALGYHVLKPVRARLASGPSEHPGAVQSLLAPDFEAVQEAVAVIGNAPRNNRTYDDWIAVCHALAGATGKSTDGRALWLSWSAQWDPSEAATRAAERRWDSVSLETVGIGWGWLETLAAGESATYRTSMARDDFADPEDPEPEPDDGGADELFEVRRDHPTLDEIENAIDLLSEDDAVSPVLKLIALSRVPFTERDRLLKRIKLATRLGMTSLRHELANFTRELNQEADDPQKRAAMVTLAEHFNKLLIRDRDNRFFRYADGFWQPITAATIRAAVDAVTSDHPELLSNAAGQRQSSTAIINGANDRIADYATRLFLKLEAHKPGGVLVACRNAVICFDDAGEMSVRKHDPANLFFGRLEIDYDPRAVAPIYNAMLADMMSLSRYTFLKHQHPDIAAEIEAGEVLEESSPAAPVTLGDGMVGWRQDSEFNIVDAGDDARLLNEIFGYGLLPWRKAQQCVIFTGNGSNGKSRLVQLYTRRLVGMTSNMNVDQLGTRFVFHYLDGKRVLVIDEGSKTNELRDDILKMLTEDSTLTVDVKNSAHRDISLRVLLIMNTNNHLHISDASYGLRRRLVIVPFGRQYENTGALDPAGRIMTSEEEYSGALNQWLAGAQRVLKRGRIKPSKSAVHAFNNWMKRNSTEDDFIRSQCVTKRPEQTKSSGEALETLHQGFLNWYRLEVGNNSAAKAHGKRTFSETLAKLGFPTYLSNGITRVTGLWLNPAQQSMSADSFAARDFDPITPEL